MGLRRWNKDESKWESFGTPQLDATTIGAASLIHAVQHGIGGNDPISPAAIGALPVASASVVLAPTNSNVIRNITVSTSAPSGGSDGDVWLKYS